MLRVAVEDIQSGMVLARPIPVPAEPERCLLGRDAEIPCDLVPHLQSLGINEIWVRCPDLEFLEEVIVDQVDHQQRVLYAQVRNNFERIMGQATVELDLVHFQNSIATMFEFLQSVRVGHSLLEKLANFDNYLMSHSTNVCYIAMLVGMKLTDYLEQQSPDRTGGRDLRLLGLGCLLHDVGKMRVPAEILNKPAKLTPEEFDVMKRHPTIGFDMLEGLAPSDAADVVLNHHQRWDGRGYPEIADRRTGWRYRTLNGEEIPVFSRIATMADIFDAATSKRCYSDAKPAVQVLHEMRTWCKGAFDPVVEQAFYEVIPAFPIGQTVQLTNGLEAVVVDFNPGRPVEPKVKCIRSPDGERFDDPSQEEIDLATTPDLDITSVRGIDVRPFLSTQRAGKPQNVAAN